MSYSSVVLADSPVRYWRLGDSSGVTAVDSSGNARNGTYVNSPTLGVTGLIAGDADTAVTFNGTSQRVTVDSVFTWTGLAASAEAWVKLTTVAGPDVLCGFYQSLTPFTGWGFGVGILTAGHLGYFSSAKGSWVESAGTIDTATHHVAVTVSSGGAVTFYIDGGPAGTAVSNGPVNYTGTRSICSRGAGDSNWVHGTVDEVALYNAVLSPTQVAAHYAAGIATATPLAIGQAGTYSQDLVPAMWF